MLRLRFNLIIINLYFLSLLNQNNYQFEYLVSKYLSIAFFIMLFITVSKMSISQYMHHYQVFLGVIKGHCILFLISIQIYRALIDCAILFIIPWTFDNNKNFCRQSLRASAKYSNRQLWVGQVCGSLKELIWLVTLLDRLTGDRF